MFEVQGRKCTKPKFKKPDIKKGIRLSLYLDRSTPSKKIETVRYTAELKPGYTYGMNSNKRLKNSTDTNNFSMFSRNSNTPIPVVNRFNLVYSENPPKTPSLLNKQGEIKRVKVSVTKIINKSIIKPEFKSPLEVYNKKVSHKLFSKTRGKFFDKNLKPRDSSLKPKTEKIFDKKITMRDLNLNLPNVIRLRKFTKKSLYRPSFSENFY
jgi:hypothetical protein